ncbi:MAG: hypothetical protein HS111_34410 [Kofleriaceae bacterium]|nr:hypothetical protein [Kofleriaceae bacterium]
MEAVLDDPAQNEREQLLARMRAASAGGAPGVGRRAGRDPQAGRGRSVVAASTAEASSRLSRRR